MMRNTRAKVTRRWYDADDGCWWYETTVNQPKLYPEGVLEASNRP